MARKNGLDGTEHFGIKNRLVPAEPDSYRAADFLAQLYRDANRIRVWSSFPKSIKNKTPADSAGVLYDVEIRILLIRFYEQATEGTRHKQVRTRRQFAHGNAALPGRSIAAFEGSAGKVRERILSVDVFEV